jgi:hypothetical protein
MAKEIRKNLSFVKYYFTTLGRARAAIPRRKAAKTPSRHKERLYAIAKG